MQTGTECRLLSDTKMQTGTEYRLLYDTKMQTGTEYRLLYYTKMQTGTECRQLAVLLRRAHLMGTYKSTHNCCSVPCSMLVVMLLYKLPSSSFVSALV